MSSKSSPSEECLLLGIGDVISKQMPRITSLKLSDLKRVFGGNARLAWSFDAVWVENGKEVYTPCIMLSQAAGGHVDSDTLHEFEVLKALSGSGLRTPTAIAIDIDGDITGSASVIMERLVGESNVVQFRAAEHAISSHQKMLDLAEISAGLHQFDWISAGLSAEDENPTFFQIDHWHQVYLENRREPYPLLNELFLWLKNNRPKPNRLGIVHGDLRPGNFLYDEHHITALLDWEMAHIGDPAEDIAWIYRPLWSPEKILSIDDFIDQYNKFSEFNVSRADVVFYQIFSEMKFAALSVSASSSYFGGKSKNLRLMDRASKIPESVELCFKLIDTYFSEVRSA